MTSKTPIQNKEFTNWSGDVKFTPACFEIPDSEKSLLRIVQNALSTKSNIRTVGSRHSCSPIFETRDILVSMHEFLPFYHADPDKLLATVSPQLTIEEIGKLLSADGLAMENTGHIDKQTIAGAVSTGTHGAGKYLTNLSGQLHGVRLVTGKGEVREFNADEHPQMMQALKVSLGSMGFITQVTLKVLPDYRLSRRHYCAATDDCLANLESLMEENRNFCFYWYPRRDDVSIRTWNEEAKEKPLLCFARLDKQQTGAAKDTLPTDHQLKYNELEYSVDVGVAADCFREIRECVKQRHRKHVGWRILFRPVAQDDVYLSNAYGRGTVAITIHQNASLP